MTKQRVYNINGFVYDKPSLAYEDLNPPVSLSLFRQRWYRGVSCEDLIAPIKVTSHYDKENIIILSRKYKSLYQAFKLLKPPISYNLFVKRYIAGMRDYDILEPSFSGINKSKLITIDDIKYASITQAYKSLKPKMSLALFVKLVNQYPNTTLSFIESQHSLLFCIDDVPYSNVRQAYQTINPNMSFRDFKRGINSAEDKRSITMDYLVSQAKVIEINGQIYKNLQQAYVELKPYVTIKTFIRRYHNNASYNELMGLDQCARINGRDYPSYAQAKRELCPDMNMSTFRYKLIHDKNFVKQLNKKR